VRARSQPGPTRSYRFEGKVSRFVGAVAARLRHLRELILRPWNYTNVRSHSLMYGFLASVSAFRGMAGGERTVDAGRLSGPWDACTRRVSLLLFSALRWADATPHASSVASLCTARLSSFCSLRLAIGWTSARAGRGKKVLCCLVFTWGGVNNTTCGRMNADISKSKTAGGLVKKAPASEYPECIETNLVRAYP